MATLLVIADDFTGALDTGVKFAEKGASVLIFQFLFRNRHSQLRRSPDPVPAFPLCPHG